MKFINIIIFTVSTVCTAAENLYLEPDDRRIWYGLLPERMVAWGKINGYDTTSITGDKTLETMYNARTLPRIEWMKKLAKESLKRFKEDSKRSSKWNVSPSFIEISKPLMSDTTWNCRTFIKDVMELPGGCIFPTEKGGNGMGKIWEDKIGEMYKSCGYRVENSEVNQEWPNNETITKWALQGNMEEINKAEKSVESGWRILTRSIQKALVNICGQDYSYNVATINESEINKDIKIKIVKQEWECKAKLNYDIIEKDKKPYLKGSGSVIITENTVTNEASIFDLSIFTESTHEGDFGPVYISGIAIMGFPSTEEIEDLKNKGTKDYLGEIPVYTLESADILDGLDLEEQVVEKTFKANWIKEIVYEGPDEIQVPIEETYETVKMPGNKEFWLENMTTKWLYIISSWRNEMDKEGEDTTERTFRNIKEEYLTTIWHKDIIERIKESVPEDCKKELKREYEPTINNGQVKIDYKNTGVVHYWYRDDTDDEPGKYLGYRVNGKSYENGKLEEFEDDEGESVIMGGWEAVLPVYITGSDMKNGSIRCDIKNRVFGTIKNELIIMSQ